jgi:hypothetical protein
LALTAGEEGVALRSRVLSPMVVVAFRQVPLAKRAKLGLAHFR